LVGRVELLAGAVVRAVLADRLGPALALGSRRPVVDEPPVLVEAERRLCRGGVAAVPAAHRHQRVLRGASGSGPDPLPCAVVGFGLRNSSTAVRGTSTRRPIETDRMSPRLSAAYAWFLP